MNEFNNYFRHKQWSKISQALSIAKIYTNREKISEALQILIETNEIFPNIYEINRLLGILYCVSDNYQKSVDILERVIKHNPNDKEVLEYYAIGLYQLKREKEAVECARRYFKLIYKKYPEVYPNIDFKIKIDVVKYLLNYYNTLLPEKRGYCRINNEGWLFLFLKKKFIAKIIASFLLEYSQISKDNEMYYRGKELLAATLVRSKRLVDIKKASELFEDIAENSPVSYSVLDYEICKEKIKTPSKFKIIDRKEKKDVLNELVSLLSLSSDEIKIVLDEISKMLISDPNLKNKVFQLLMKIIEQYPESSCIIGEFLSNIKRTKFKTFKIHLSNPYIGFGYYSFEGNIEIYLNNHLIINEPAVIYPDSFLRGINQNILVDFKKELGKEVLLEKYAHSYRRALKNPGFFWNITHDKDNVIIDNICWNASNNDKKYYREIKGNFQVKLKDYESEVLNLKEISKKTYEYYEKMNCVWK